MERLELKRVRVCTRCGRGRAELEGIGGHRLVVPLDAPRARVLERLAAPAPSGDDRVAAEAEATRNLADFVLAQLHEAGAHPTEVVLDHGPAGLRALLSFEHRDASDVLACTAQEGRRAGRAGRPGALRERRGPGSGRRRAGSGRAADAALSDRLTRGPRDRAGRRAAPGCARRRPPAPAGTRGPPLTTANGALVSAATNPDSAAPSWFDAPMKRRLTALTRPRSASGVESWMAVRASRRSPDRRRPPACRPGPRAETSATARRRWWPARTTPTATSSARAGAPDGRTDHEHERGQERADLERRAEEPVAARSDVQDLGGVDRQQRGGAAEDDGEHVEHHAAEHHRPAADEAESLADGAPASPRHASSAP